MAIALKVVSIDRTRRKLRITYQLTFSGSYVATGDVLPFATATDPSFLGYRVPSIPPEFIQPDGAPGGQGLEGVIGTTIANCKLKQWTAGSGAAAPVEVTAGAYSALVLADTNCTITAVFGRGAN